MLCHHTSTWEKQPVSQPWGTEDLEQVRTDQVQHTGAHCPASILRQLPGSQLQQKILGLLQVLRRICSSAGMRGCQAALSR